MQKIKNVLRIVVVIVIIFLGFQIFGGTYKNGYFEKKITKADFFYIRSNQDFTHGFKAKKSLVLWNDKRRAKKKNAKLLYKFGKTYIIMEKKENWILKVTGTNFKKLEDEELCNFSILKRKDGGLAIYGNSTQSGFFISINVYQNGKTFSEVRTYNNDVPFAYKHLGVPSKIGSYWYANTDEQIYFFRKGEIKAYQSFPGKIYNSYIINGGYIIADEDGNKNIYKVEVYANQRHPYVSYSFIATIDSYDDYRITSIEGRDETLLVIKQEGKEFVAIPENWDDYWEMDMIGDTGNGVKFNLVPVEELRLKPVDDID